MHQILSVAKGGLMLAVVQQTLEQNPDEKIQDGNSRSRKKTHNEPSSPTQVFDDFENDVVRCQEMLVRGSGEFNL